ncbi:MAG: hypothetical protein EHM89_00205 [Acidobacteria bacterium]|nr:MAG: hypothetical protein EHM89_00205 [Acidobacteriota bacterium]
MTAIAGKTDEWENGLLLLLFNNTDFTLVGDAGGLRGSATAGSLYVSLHTADPTEEAADQTASEITYTSYARVAKARSSSGWTVSGSSVIPNGAITFPAGTGGSGTASFFGVGTDSAGGSGKLLYAGAISPTIVCGAGVTPQLTTATTISEA